MNGFDRDRMLAGVRRFIEEDDTLLIPAGNGSVFAGKQEQRNKALGKEPANGERGHSDFRWE